MQRKEKKLNKYINREISWLKFNLRVLAEASNLKNPILERLKFLSIAANNLDEFFMVRVAGIYNQIKDKVSFLSHDGLTSEKQLERIIIKTKKLLAASNDINFISFLPLGDRGLSKSLILASFQLDLECLMTYKFNIIVIY